MECVMFLPLCSFASREHRSEWADYGVDAYSPHVSRLVLMQFLVQGPELVFAPIDESFADDGVLLPSDSNGTKRNRTLEPTSTLEAGSGGAQAPGDTDPNNYNLRSVLTIAFQFMFENHMRDNVAAMARQYVRSVVGSVQRVAMAIAPSRLSTHITLNDMEIPNFELDNEVDRREREVVMHHDVVEDHVEHNAFDDNDLNDLLA
ncbi:hypothetical protein K1719_038412 [Acacia pycnantha]|nr:hypothetical protein K1719_038412 [Acacia pycnantha]